MSFQICARKKPKLLLSEKGGDVLKIKNNSLSVFQQKKRYDNENGCIIHKFKLDTIFDESSTNLSVYNKLLNSQVLDTYGEIFLFAYGETGTGKTYTVFGSNREVGLFQLLSRDILEDENVSQVHAKVFEVYNDKVYDLLNKRNKIIIRENANKKFCLKGCSKKYIFDNNDILDIEDKIKNERIIGETCYNHRSSRSHAIVQLVIERKDKEDQKISIIDLAGSEKASSTIFRDNVMYSENSSINKNLLALKECIRSTYMNNPHIPFRSCALTKILRLMFMKDSYTIMISTISSGEKMCKSTLDTLKYTSYIKIRNPNTTSRVMKKREIDIHRDKCVKKLDMAKQCVLRKSQNPVDLFSLTTSIDKFLEKSK